MERKKAVYQGLKDIPVYREDTSMTSPDYFQISEFPERLTAGKNLIKLRGNADNLQVNTYVNVEILDYNGDPIYNEFIEYIDEDKSRVISIYIYPETSPGDATVIITGTAKKVPNKWKNKTNIRWSRTLAVNPTTPNISEIIFTESPTINITEQVSVQLNRQYTNDEQFPVYNTGTIRLLTLNEQPAVILSGGKFNSDMVNGTLTVTESINPLPAPRITPDSNTYTTPIKKILSDTTALLTDQYIVYSSQSLSPHYYSTFDDSPYQISYEQAPTYIPTQNSESVSIVEIRGLEPATGDVSRIKVYTSGKGTVGTWELTNDIELIETEIFVSSTSSIDPYRSIGIFTTQSIIDDNWEPHTYVGKAETTAPTLTWDTGSINNGMDIISPIDITAKNTVHVVQVQDARKGIFIKDSAYKVTMDGIANRSTTSSNKNPKIHVYMSGSSFNYDTTDYYNQELPVTMGKKIGQIEVSSNSKRIDDHVFNFKADEDGTGVLLFVIESGDWILSDIRTTTDNDSGYTPNYTRIRTEIPTKHKSANQLGFKIEYYNIDGVRSKLISYVYDKPWEGGNRYIDGDYSMITGSLYVADTLQSGIAISGYKDTGYVRSLGYTGFSASNPGFLMWSGSALSGSGGTKGGVPYSGVGLELFANTESYFRYSTTDNEIDVRTDSFFFGNPDTTFISGANGNIEISSSGFYLSPQGDVTASSFISVGPNGDVLFNSNSEFVDGLNVGRVVYFNRDEYSFTGDLNASPQTASIFETFILPGETSMQLSVTSQFENNNGAGTRPIRSNFYIQSASNTDSSPGADYYDNWSTPESISPQIEIISVSPSSTHGNSRNIEITTNVSSVDTFVKYQGTYSRIYMIVRNGASGTGTDVLKMKNFVYRTSREVGSSIIPPPNPIK